MALHGITAFDPQGVSGRDSVFQRLNETLMQLAKEDRREFYALARDPASYLKRESSAPERNRLLRRFANLDLIQLDEKGQFGEVRPLIVKFLQAQALITDDEPSETAPRSCREFADPADPAEGEFADPARRMPRQSRSYEKRY